MEAARRAHEERECREAEEWQKWQEEERKEVAAVEEQWQSLSKGLLGLTLTILAPSSIAHTASGLLTQSKGKRKVTEEDFSASLYILFIWLSSIADCFWRSRFPSCDSCTIAGVLCSTELWKHGTWRMLCNQCQQWKMACHWDLIGITSPQDQWVPLMILTPNRLWNISKVCVMQDKLWKSLP
jgi:hypothetical protein